MSDEPTDQKTPDELDIDALAGAAVLGDRIRLEEKPAAPPPPPASPMDDLVIAPDAGRMRLQEKDPAGAEADPFARPKRSTLDPIARDQKPPPRDDLPAEADEKPGDDDEALPSSALEQLVAEWTKMLLRRGVSLSSIESLLSLFGARIDLRPVKDSAPGLAGGDVSTSGDRASRIVLREGAAPAQPMAILEALMAFTARLPLHDDPQSAAAGALEIPLLADGRMSLRGLDDEDAAASPGADPFASLAGSERLPLRDAPDAAPSPSSMGDLFAMLEAATRDEGDDAGDAAPSTMEALFVMLAASAARSVGEKEERPASSMGDLFELLEREQQDDKPSALASTMGDLFAMLDAAPRDEGDGAGSVAPSTMNDLFKMLKATRDKAPVDAPTSSMSDLFKLLERERKDDKPEALASTMGDLFATLGAAPRDEGDDAGGVAPSTMEALFVMLAASAARKKKRSAGEKEERPASTMGDLFKLLEAVRKKDADEGPESTMGDLLKLLESAERTSRDTPAARSTMRDVFSTEVGSRFPLFEKPGDRTRGAPNDLSQIMSGPAAPRLELPKRTSTRNTPPAPDGVTPMPPLREVVYGELDPRQGCPKKGVKPREIGEAVHERLDFRYNRFRRLEIRRPVFDCPGCPDVASFHGLKPAYQCQEAPIGDGLLAMVVVSRYFDRLPMDRLRTLLEQLGAPIPNTALLNELDRASEQIAPIVERMRAGAKTEEAPLPALVTGTLRDTPGSVQVHTGGGHVVFSFDDGEARKSDANRTAGPIALQRWRGQGTRGRWSQIRQRFFLALLTDPERARSGLYAIEKLPPDPPADARALRELKKWLDEAYQTFGAPRDRFQHAVTATLAMWSFLTTPETDKRVHASDTWVFEGPDGDVHAALRWLSLTESCASLGVQPWAYLHALLGALSAGPLMPEEWTPAAYADRT